MIAIPLARLFRVKAPARRAAPARRRSARVAVLWGAAALFLANVGLAVSLETVLPQLRDPEYGYRIERALQWQRERPGRPMVVVVGTSRTQNAVTPAEMGFPDGDGAPLVFNFGMAGARPVQQRLTLQRLRADGVRPAAVLVEVCPGTLIVPGPADYLVTPYVTRLTFTDIRRLEPYLADPGALRRLWAKERLDTWSAQQPVLLSHIAPGWQSWRQRIDFQWQMLDEYGFTPYPGDHVDEHRAERTAKARAEYGPALRDLRVSELSERAYLDVAADCRAAGIPLAFFLTPESPDFQALYSPQSRQALDAFLRRLAGDTGCPVFAPPDDYGEGDFGDGHHMLPGGAAKYSRWLADKQIKPWLSLKN